MGGWATIVIIQMGEAGLSGWGWGGSPCRERQVNPWSGAGWPEVQRPGDLPMSWLDQRERAMCLPERGEHRNLKL